jgi:hypothetical protein
MVVHFSIGLGYLPGSPGKTFSPSVYSLVEQTIKVKTVLDFARFRRYIRSKVKELGPIPSGLRKPNCIVAY